MDVTIVNVALPSIAKELHASTAGLQWSIDGYTVVIASFLMLAGSTADRLGRRRIFQTGLVLFSLGSLLCSFAGSIEMLVAFRVAQALGGAMLNPVAMSIIVNTFTDPKQRAQAIGMWGAVFGISMALGPLLGGFLVQNVGWRSVFWINVPIAAMALVATFKYVPESRAAKPRRLDPIGQLLIVVILGALTSSLIEVHERGWGDPWIVAGITTVVLGLVALIIYERKRIEPLIELRFFKSVPFAVATLLAVVAFSSFNGAMFLSSLYLQTARGLTAQHAGMCLLPIAVALAICSPMSGRLVGSGRVRLPLIIAGCALIAGASLFVGLDLDSWLPQLIVGFGLLGVGLGMINAPITNAAVSGMPRSQAGVASALASTSRQVGATIGIALSGSIVGVSAADPAFSHAARPFFWFMVAGGVAIVILGVIATSKRALASARTIALDE